jgi:hypothetical protein
MATAFNVDEFLDEAPAFNVDEFLGPDPAPKPPKPPDLLSRLFSGVDYTQQAPALTQQGPTATNTIAPVLPEAPVLAAPSPPSDQSRAAFVFANPMGKSRVAIDASRATDSRGVLAKMVDSWPVAPIDFRADSAHQRELEDAQPKRFDPTKTQFASPSEAITPRGLGRSIADTALGYEQGFAGLLKGVTDNVLAGDNPVSKFLESASSGAQKLKSQDAIQQAVKRDDIIYQATKAGGEIGAVRASTSTLFNYPAAGLDVLARGAGSMGPIVGLGMAGTGLKTMGALNALSNSGDAANQTAEQLRNLPREAWRQDAQYLKLESQGVPHQQIVAMLAPTLAIPAQLGGGASGFLSGITGLEKAIAGKATGNALRQRIGRAGAEQLGEIGETLIPQGIGNLTAGAMDNQTPFTQGFGQAFMDTVAGTMPGSALAARRVGPGQNTPLQAPIPFEATTPPAAPPAQPVPPVSPAPAASPPAPLPAAPAPAGPRFLGGNSQLSGAIAGDAQAIADAASIAPTRQSELDSAIRAPAAQGTAGPITPQSLEALMVSLGLAPAKTPEVAMNRAAPEVAPAPAPEAAPVSAEAFLSQTPEAAPASAEAFLNAPDSQPNQPPAQSAPAQAAIENVAPQTPQQHFDALPANPDQAGIDAAMGADIAGRVAQDELPRRYGVGHVPMDEGGKVFQTRRQAKQAKRLQPALRVIATDGGYVLGEKSDAQMAAEERAGRRLGFPRTGQAGYPIAAHELIADAGGMAPGERADMGMEGNVRIGNRSLFAGAGRGLTMERTIEKLIEEGYLPEDASHQDARDLIKRSLTNPQYNADGWEQAAQMEQDARQQAHEDAMMEEALQAEKELQAAGDEGYAEFFDNIRDGEFSYQLGDATMTEQDWATLDKEWNEQQTATALSAQGAGQPEQVAAGRAQPGNRPGAGAPGQQAAGQGRAPTPENPPAVDAAGTGQREGQGQAQGVAQADELNAALAESTAQAAQAKKLANGQQSVRFTHPDGKRKALANQDASIAGGWRLTRMDENGPSGHSEHPTLEAAVLRALESGYTPQAQEAPAARKVGDMVKLTKPNADGGKRINIAGIISRILPDGRMEIRTQNDGYMTVTEADLGHIAHPPKPAAPAPAPEEVPPSVRSNLQWALTQLRDVEAALTGVQRARGDGHHLQLEIQDQQAKQVRPNEILDEFRRLAKDKGIDGEAFIESLGGVPDLARFSKPAPAAPALDLAGQSNQEIIDKEAADLKAAKAEAKAAKDAEAKARKEREQKETSDRARQDASAENFTLGQNAEDAIAGQSNVFDAPAPDSISEPAKPYADAESPPVWRSGLVEGITGLKAEAANAASWQEGIKSLLNKGAIKADEVQWSGLTDWLALQSGKVTKRQVLDYLEGNGVRIEETMLGDLTEESKRDTAFHKQNVQFAQDKLDTLLDEASTLMSKAGASQVQLANASLAFRSDQPGQGSEALDKAYQLLHKAAPDSYDMNQINDAQDELKSAQDERHYALQRVEKTSKFGNYQLEGERKDYRELLLTLPSKNTISDENIAKWYEESYGASIEDEAGPDWRNRRGEFITEMTRVDREDRQDLGDYQSSHWAGTPNVLAHIRFNERTDAQGKRVLFIEEIQSDWGQAGKKEGFAASAAERAVIDAVGREVDAAGGFSQASPELQARSRQAGAALSKTGVPVAPFVGKTDAWVALAIKRMVTYAAQNGFDKVAFVNGAQSADRYDLSKQVDKLIYAQEEDGTFSMVGEKDGREIVRKDTIKREALADFVGKEVAEKMIAGEGNSIPGGPERELSGAGLRVGGGGMRAFYDAIVPKVARDVLKKLGGGPLVNVALKAPQDNPVTHRYVGPQPTSQEFADLLKTAHTGGRNIMESPITGTRMDFAVNRVSNAQALKAINADIAAGSSFSEAVGMHGGDEVAQLLGGKIERVPDAEIPQKALDQTGFDITPALREKAGAGLSMFQKAKPYNAQAPRRKYTDDKQLQLFLDHGPDPSQKGEAGQAAQRQAVSAVDDLRSTGSLLAKALSGDYAARQRTSLVGQKIGSTADLAVLAQVYRDPRFETFRVVFVNDKGAVVSQLGLTSRLPASSAAIVGTNTVNYLSDMGRIAQNQGATGYYMLHNHPSSLVEASRSDVNLTQIFWNHAHLKGGPKMLGHVILDTNEYTVIDGKTGNTELVKKDFGQAAPVTQGQWGGYQINNPTDVARLAKQLATDGDGVTVVVTDHQYTVKNVLTLPFAPLDAASHKDNKHTLLRHTMAATGSKIFLVGRNEALLRQLAPHAVDAVLVKDSGEPVSLASQGLIRGNGNVFPAERATRLSPDTSPEWGYLRPFTGQRVKVAEPAKALTESKFYNDYRQHIDLRGDPQSLQSIMRDGFKPGIGPNLLPPYRGGKPDSIVARRFMPRAGQTVFLVPKAWVQVTPNGDKIKPGWIPQPYEVIHITSDGPAMYEEYIKALNASGDLSTSDKVQATSPAYPPKSSPAAPAPWDVSVPDTKDAFIRAIQNNKIDVQRVSDAIEKQFGRLADQVNVTMNQTLYAGAVAARVTALHKVTVNPLLAKLAVAGKNAGITTDDLNEYLHARHAPERNHQMQLINPDMVDNEALSGMSNLEADNVIARFIANGKAPGLRVLAKDVYQLLSDTRTAMVADGLESAQTVAAWEASYHHYVPLQRDIEGAGTPKGQGVSVRGPEAKRAVGSNREVVNILANIVEQAELEAIRAEKSILGRTLLAMARQYPNPAFWSVDIKPMKPRIDPQTGLVNRTAIDPLYQSADNVVMIKDYGAEHFVVFNKNNPRAKQMARNMKNLDMAELSALTQAAAHATRFMASLLTQRNPVFWGKNFARDIQAVMVNLEGTDAQGLQHKVLANLPNAFKGMHEYIRKGTTTTKNARDAKLLFDTGGTTGYMQAFGDSDERMKDIKKIVAQMGQGKADPRKLARTALDFIDNYNEIIENAVRLSVFQTARQSGLSDMRSAVIAKEMSIDFNRRGNLSPGINGLYMFFNAGVQGTAQLAKVLATSPSARVLVGMIATMGFMQDLIGRMMAGDDDDTGRNRYDLIPEYIKSRNWIFMNPMRPGEWVEVPLPIGPHVFHNAGRLLSDALFRKDPRNAAEYGSAMAGIVFDAFSPLGAAPSFAQLALPSLADPIQAIAENKTFSGSAVYKSDEKGFGHTDPKPAYTRHFENTPSVWKAASRGLNDITGGDKDKKGMINWEPDLLKFVFYTITGGPGRTLDQALDATQSQARGVTPSVNRIPLVSSFYGVTDDQMRERAYYDDKKRVSDAQTQRDFYNKAGRRELAMQVETDLGDGDIAKGRRMIATFAATGKTVAMLNKEIRARLDKADAGSDEADQLKALKERRTRAMGRAVRKADQGASAAP